MQEFSILKKGVSIQEAKTKMFDFDPQKLKKIEKAAAP